MVTHEEFVANRRPRVFCGSLCDWLDPEIPVEWLADLLDVIRLTPNIDWLLLTKRPELWRERLSAARSSLGNPTFGRIMDWLHGKPPPNVWIGTTCEDQQRADERIPHLLSIPAKVRFLSCEPLLGPVDLRTVSTNFALALCEPETARRHAIPNIDWVICGCESGPKRRPTHPAWIYSLKEQCAFASVLFFVKQMFIAGKVEHDSDMFPADLRVREVPTSRLLDRYRYDV